jgi:hypothetical protein
LVGQLFSERDTLQPIEGRKYPNKIIIIIIKNNNNNNNNNDTQGKSKFPLGTRRTKMETESKGKLAEKWEPKHKVLPCLC